MYIVFNKRSTLLTINWNLFCHSRADPPLHRFSVQSGGQSAVNRNKYLDCRGARSARWALLGDWLPQLVFLSLTRLIEHQAQVECYTHNYIAITWLKYIQFYEYIESLDEEDQVQPKQPKRPRQTTEKDGANDAVLPSLPVAKTTTGRKNHDAEDDGSDDSEVLPSLPVAKKTNLRKHHAMRTCPVCEKAGGQPQKAPAKSCPKGAHRE